MPPSARSSATAGTKSKKTMKKDPDPIDDSDNDVERNQDFKATLTTKSDRMVRKIQCTILGGTSAVRKIYTVLGHKEMYG